MISVKARAVALAIVSMAGFGCSEDERTPVGPGNPSAIYCVGIGYDLINGRCVFPDGTSCEEWAFYRAECGTEHSSCNQHGGTIANVVTDFGTWTGSVGMCTIAGAQCSEESFWRMGRCP